MSPDRSLFVVALPRSLSTEVHHQAALALGLHTPRWTSAGEILNGDRLAFLDPRTEGENPKFTPPEAGYAFEQLTEFLDDTVCPQGRAYKDVTQPFVTAGWLPGRGLAVLHVRREPAEVARAMQRVGWWYPGNAAPPVGEPHERLLRGLARAQAALEAIPAEVVEFSALLESPEPLRAALQRLYPAREIPPLDYIDEGFRLRRRRWYEERGAF